MILKTMLPFLVVVFSSIVNAEENANLSKERLAAILDDIDADDDGVVENLELENWIKDNTEFVKEAAAKEALDEFDDDDDEAVSWEELTAKNKLYGEYSKMQKELFEIADEDDDGELTLKEFIKFKNPADYPELRESLSKNLFKNLDDDNDGKLSEAELQEIGTEPENFDEEDEDNDGFINKNEFFDLIHSNLEETLDDVLDILHSADDDLDGKLEMDELLEEPQLLAKTVIGKYGAYLMKEGKITTKDEL